MHVILSYSSVTSEAGLGWNTIVVNHCSQQDKLWYISLYSQRLATRSIVASTRGKSSCILSHLTSKLISFVHEIAYFYETKLRYIPYYSYNAIMTGTSKLKCSNNFTFSCDDRILSCLRYTQGQIEVDSNGRMKSHQSSIQLVETIPIPSGPETQSHSHLQNTILSGYYPSDSLAYLIATYFVMMAVSQPKDIPILSNQKAGFSYAAVAFSRWF